MTYDDFEELPEEFLQSEAELRRENKRLLRLMKKAEKWHDKEIDGLRGQIRELLEKNMDLTETCNLFARGIDRLKDEKHIITESHHWTRKGARGLKERIGDFTNDGKRIVTIVPMFTDPQGHTTEALIVTEHIEKTKPKPTKLFNDI